MIRSRRLAAVLLLAAPFVGPAVGSTPAAAATCTQPIPPGEVAQPVPWAQRMLAPERVWPLANGTGITVAVIDSGVDSRHPQMRGQVLPGRDYLYEKGGRADRDCVGHGTAVASIIAAKAVDGTGFRGVAPGATILPLTVSERRADEKGQSGQAVTPAEFAVAVRDAVASGAKVINISAVFTTDHPEVRAAIKAAIDANVAVVAAVGNAAEDGNPNPYPAAYDDVIGVGGIDERGQRLRTSGRGPFVDVMAPANAVTAAIPTNGHGSYTGTSFAAPFVSAVAALVRQYHPELNARQVATRLAATASPAPGGPNSTGYGHGIIDPYRAVAERLNASPAPTAAPRPVRQQVDPAAVAREEEIQRLTRTALTTGTVMLLLTIIAMIVGLVRGPGRRRRWRPGRAARPPPTADPPGQAPARLFDDLDRIEQN